MSAKKAFNALERSPVKIIQVITIIENNNNLISLYNDTTQGEIAYRLTFDSKNVF